MAKLIWLYFMLIYSIIFDTGPTESKVSNLFWKVSTQGSPNETLY